jgi:hypothetical protein
MNSVKKYSTRVSTQQALTSAKGQKMDRQKNSYRWETNKKICRFELQEKFTSVHGLGRFNCYDFRKGDLLVILAAGVILEQGDGFRIQAPVMTFALMVKDFNHTINQKF